MNKRWYKIFELSVKALLAYAKPGNGCWYFDLDREATKNCIKLPVREQKENALFDQLMIMRNKPLTSKDGAVITDLSEVIFYADFSGIFDRDAGNPYYATLQDKAKSLFIPGNLMLDLGGGQKCCQRTTTRKISPLRHHRTRIQNQWIVRLWLKNCRGWTRKKLR